MPSSDHRAPSGPRPRRRRAGARPGVALALLAVALPLVLLGCSAQGTDAAAPEPPGTSDAGTPPAPVPPAVPAPPPSSADPVPALDCDAAVRADVEAVVDGQLAAFGDGDLERAHGFATEAFRAAVPLERFEVIIRDGYSALLAIERHELLECRSDGSRTAAIVGVVATDGAPALLAYDLVLEPVGWRVRGAQLLGAGGAPALTA